jgi:hypothetical protein
VLFSLPTFRVSLSALNQPEPLPLGLCLPVQPIVRLEGLPTFSETRLSTVNGAPGAFSAATRGGQLRQAKLARHIPSLGVRRCHLVPPFPHRRGPKACVSASDVPASLRNSPFRGCRCHRSRRAGANRLPPARDMGRRTSGAFRRPDVCEAEGGSQKPGPRSSALAPHPSPASWCRPGG